MNQNQNKAEEKPLKTSKEIHCFLPGYQIGNEALVCSTLRLSLGLSSLF